ncbi:COX15/CtaA family protein [Methylocella sp.]|uniref:COX15/CtaA family protein n=1 Tax=Methylocella sp. TaxID=1978226 RepID=UPI003783D289
MVWVYDPPAAVVPAFAARRNNAVAAWLWSLAALVFLMVLVGGATRLMEKIRSNGGTLTGVVPPLSQAEWLAEFENYKQIPQYAQVFPDMTLAGFKIVYFFEWAHRLLGRLIGAALALPLVIFWLRGDLSARLKPQLLGLLALGGLQGFVGWWMVKSGLTLHTEVAQERLAVHLLLASASFVWILWLAAGETRRLRAPILAPARRRALLAFSLGLLALLFVQIGFGALVAGLRAGRVYMSWPLMEGRCLPPADEIWRLSPAWANHFDNPMTAQLQHRLLAYALLLALAQALYAYVKLGDDPATRRAIVLALLVFAQMALAGIDAARRPGLQGPGAPCAGLDRSWPPPRSAPRRFAREGARRPEARPGRSGAQPSPSRP